MIFITEDDLRDLYKTAPFTTYTPKEGTRLTPGARQFLVDRGIDMYSQESRKNTMVPVKGKSLPTGKEASLPVRRLQARMRSIHGSFLESLSAAIEENPAGAQELAVLSRQLTSLKSLSPEWSKATNLCCMECTGIKNENFSQDLGECFEINEFHLQAPKGKEIIRLHHLRNQLQELEVMALELLSSGETEGTAAEELISRINQMVNTLNRMICAAFGGETCLRQT